MNAQHRQMLQRLGLVKKKVYYFSIFMLKMALHSCRWFILFFSGKVKLGLWWPGMFEVPTLGSDL